MEVGFSKQKMIKNFLTKNYVFFWFTFYGFYQIGYNNLTQLLDFKSRMIMRRVNVPFQRTILFGSNEFGQTVVDLFCIPIDKQCWKSAWIMSTDFFEGFFCPWIFLAGQVLRKILKWLEKTWHWKLQLGVNSNLLAASSHTINSH